MTANQFNFCVQNAMDFTDPDAYVSELALSDIWGDAPDAPIPQARLDDLRQIYDAVTRSVRDIVDAASLGQAAFARKHCIPVRTVNNWCLPVSSPEHRDCPLYVRLLLQRAEGLLTC